MATFTVSQFDSADGAEQTLATLERLQKEDLIEIEDAAIVSWPVGAKKPKTKQLHSLAGAGAMSGAFWGMLFGLIFFVPLLGAAAVGGGIGALWGKFRDRGIDDDLMKRVGGMIAEGQAVVFALGDNASIDAVNGRVRGPGAPRGSVRMRVIRGG